MSGPITNYELGKIKHQEYEREASRYWGQNASRNGQSSLSRRQKLVVALSGTMLAFFAIALMVAI
jgi:hypothetical protein